MMNPSSPNHHLNEEYYFIKDSNTFFSFRLIQTPTLSILMTEGNLQSGKANASSSQIATKEMTSMNEAIAFIVQLVHQKTLEGYTLVNASKRAQNKELSIKNDDISEIPFEISSNSSEGSLSPCNVPSKSPSSQTEYLLVSEKDSKSDRKSVSDEFELIERKESEDKECKDFGQENAPIVPNTFVEQSLKIIDLQKDFDDNIQIGSCSSLKQDICTEEVYASTFHKVNKEAILKKAEELNIECNFKYCLMIYSGLRQNINEFKKYLSIKALYPKYWDFTDTNMYSEIEVAHDSQEFEEITSLMTKDFAQIQVTKLVRVQNNYLMTQYITNLNMRQEVRQAKLNRKLLFYSNQLVPSEMNKIFDTGFDTQSAEEGSMFRKRLEFVQRASKSIAFAMPVNIQEDKYQLILADVFVGKTYRGLAGDKVPPEGFDSMSLGYGNYIICNNFHSYPLYLIEYTTIGADTSGCFSIAMLTCNITPIDTSANPNLNYLAPSPLQVSDELRKEQKMLKWWQKALKKNETEQKLEKIRPSIYNNRPSVSALNRIKKDIIEIQTDTSLDFLFIEKPKTNLWTCTLCLIGPPYSAYERGIFRIELTFPEDYPLNPPLVSFKTRIYHPCIDDSGNICLGLLNQWTPSGSVKQIGLLISALLDNPLLEEPLMLDISSQYETNKQNFVSQARLWTQKYAE